jgi:hypothetical protein
MHIQNQIGKAYHKCCKPMPLVRIRVIVLALNNNVLGTCDCVPHSPQFLPVFYTLCHRDSTER